MAVLALPGETYRIYKRYLIVVVFNGGDRSDFAPTVYLTICGEKCPCHNQGGEGCYWHLVGKEQEGC